MKVGDLLHASRDIGGSRGTTGVTVGLFFVVVVTKDKAQQESRHHNVPNAQHREMAAGGAGMQCHRSGMPPSTIPFLLLCGVICQLFKKLDLPEWEKEISRGGTALVCKSLKITSHNSIGNGCLQPGSSLL